MDIIPGIGLWHVHGHQDKCFVQYASNFIPGLNDAANLEMVQWWEAEETEAQDSPMTDPTAMDVYHVRLHKAHSRKEIEIDLLQTSVTQTRERCQLGSVTWLASRITIEEMQIALAMEVQRMGRHPTETQTLEIGQHQVRLQHSIDETQLSNLGVDQLLEKYRKLEKKDLKATSAMADSNARGQRNFTLPWFWSLDIQGNSVSNDWMNECEWYSSVHWLRTKALQDRWAEELLLVGYEMRWTVNFMACKAETWLAQTSQNGEPVEGGPRCYAIRQSQMYQ
ncbi:hypothetical protein BDR05DRAFT_896918 [Suillus weaverae]|nr:hypothetical protein BDR05DRAFT_896918 [Suillus weaverae]